MKNEQLLNLFEKMKDVITEKSKYQKEKISIWNGDTIAPEFGSTARRRVAQKLKSKVDWARIGVTAYSTAINFDAFENDTIGFTRLLNDAGAYPVFQSAIDNSIISAVSFVSILPRENELPTFTAYHAGEATGIFDIRSNELLYGLVKNSYDKNGDVKDYLFFEKGKVSKINVEGKIIATVELPIEKNCLVPFVFEQDLVSRPFGKSLLSDSITGYIKDVLRIKERQSIISENNVSKSADILIGNFQDFNPEKGYLQKEADLVAMNKPITDDIKHIQLSQTDLSSWEYLEASAKIDFSSALSINPDIINGTKSNINYDSSIFDARIERCKTSYGSAIKKAAIIAMSLMAGSYIKDFEIINPRFINKNNLTSSSALGDAIYKIEQIAPGVIANDKEYMESLLGKPLKNKLLSINYPNFEKSAKLNIKYETLKSDVFDNENNLVDRNAVQEPIVIVE